MRHQFFCSGTFLLAMLCSVMLLISACTKRNAPSSESSVDGHLNGETETVLSPSLAISAAWVREVPKQQRNSAAYLNVQNLGEQTQRLIAVRSKLVDRIVIHEVINNGDLLQMREIKRIEIAPKQQVRFTPGAKHLMLMGIKVPVRVGDRVPIELLFESGQSMVVDASVKSMN